MKITHATTIFAVRDLERSLRFYTDVLGFSVEFRFDYYAGVRCDNCRIGLSGPGDPRQRQPGTGEVYSVCDEVEEYFGRIISSGALTDGTPQLRDYGMRDFAVRDPDGNVVTFGATATKPDSAEE